jgi:hypothetical protein
MVGGVASTASNLRDMAASTYSHIVLDILSASILNHFCSKWQDIRDGKSSPKDTSSISSYRWPEGANTEED